MNNDYFSKRHGYHQLREADITVQYEAPHECREILVELPLKCGFRQPVVCRVLPKRPDEKTGQNVRICTRRFLG